MISRAALLFFFCFASSSCSAQEPHEDEGAGLRLVTMTYNIRHGAGMDGAVNLKRIADVILSARPDLVALQEVDRFVERTQKTDQAEMLAELTGMYMRFGFADHYQGGEFGNIILSRFPIDSLALHPLPGPPGETRVLMEALVHVPNGGEMLPVTFMSTHLETFEEPRRSSASRINEVIPEHPERLYILGGDFNAGPQSPTMETLSRKFINPVASSPIFTYPAENPDRQIDYLLYRAPPAWSVEKVYAIKAPVSSDHAPLAAVFEYRETLR